MTIRQSASVGGAFLTPCLGYTRRHYPQRLHAETTRPSWYGGWVYTDTRPGSKMEIPGKLRSKDYETKV
jgi:hypothetical protein